MPGMKLQLPRNSLFAILLRSGWWVSALAAVGVFGAARLFLPEGLAAFAALPFAVIAVYAGFQQLTRPGAGRLAAALERARNLSSEAFVLALEQAFQQQGYAVARAGTGLELTREGKTTLVWCARWKAKRTGMEPLKEFDAATRKHEAHQRIYIVAGEVTDQGARYARERAITLMGPEELAKLLAGAR